MGKLYHKKTSRVVGSNPVARAVARDHLAASVTDMKIRLYLMVDGEACAEGMEAIGQTLAVIGYASELDPKIGAENVSVRVLRGGLSACQQLMLANKWDSAQARAIDVALDAAMELNMKVSSALISKAASKLLVH